jgi:hypothetical protein
MKTKIPYLILAGLLGTSITSLAATVVWDNGGSGNEWATAENWGGDAYPLPTDIAQVNGTRTATQSTGTPGTVANIRIGNTTNGTLNITGGTLTTTGNADIGFNNGATGTLNMSGGTLNVGTNLRIGHNGGADGIATVSGGDINVTSSLTLGNNSASAGDLTIVGDLATIDVGLNMTVAINGTSTLTFELGATGVSTIDVVNGFNIVAGAGSADLIIDGSNYTGGGGPIDLVTFGSTSDDENSWNLITFQNFAPHYSNFSIEFDADSMYLSFVPEPSSTALLGLGGLALMLRRKRS